MSKSKSKSLYTCNVMYIDDYQLFVKNPYSKLTKPNVNISLYIRLHFSVQVTSGLHFTLSLHFNQVCSLQVYTELAFYLAAILNF